LLYVDDEPVVITHCCRVGQTVC